MWRANSDHLNIKHIDLPVTSTPIQDGEGGSNATEQGKTSALLKNIWV
jgi:hypothetical protein